MTQGDVVGSNIIPVISGNSPLCEGDMLILNSTVLSGTGPVTYTWYGPSGLTATTSSPTYIIPTVTPANTGSIT
jgi:hypothetical protein